MKKEIKKIKIKIKKIKKKKRGKKLCFKYVVYVSQHT
jgi:hypothetical protein